MKEPLSKTDILHFIKAEKSFLKSEFGVVTIGLFGSYAKGEERADSDIDLLVELKEPRFEWLAGLQVHLEKKLGKKIEVVRKTKVTKTGFLERVEKDIIYA